jgi:hypothetical protein
MEIFCYTTTPIKLGLKLKKYAIDGINYMRIRTGSIYDIKIIKAIDWMITNGYLPNNYWILE